MEENAPRPAFGTSTTRFSVLGVNPAVDEVTFRAARPSTQAGPGAYDLIQEKHKSKQDPEPWSRKIMLDNFSKFRGGKSSNLLRSKKEVEGFLAPGLYNITNKMFERQSSLAVENVGFGKAKRFKESRMIIPGPGSHNVKDPKVKASTSVPTFEWDGCVDRFKDTQPRYKLPPNMYTVKDTKSIDALLEHRVSHLRTIYDCFTGPREETNMKNHFGKFNFKKPDGYYEYTTSFDEILEKPNYGKMSKTVRFPRKPCLRILLASLSNCYRDPRDPGPGLYNTEKYTSFSTEVVKYKQDVLFYPPYMAFGSSDWKSRTKIKWKIQPSVGRYFVKSCYPNAIGSKAPNKGHWVFKSKVPRELKLGPDNYSLTS